MGASLFSEDCQSSWGGFGVWDPMCQSYLQQFQLNSFSPILAVLKADEQHNRETPHGEQDHTGYLAVQICTWSITAVIDKNGEWTVDKKKLWQTLYCKVVLKFWGFCFEENVVYKEVSILDVLATVGVTCSLAPSARWGECNWYGKDATADGKSKQVFSSKMFSVFTLMCCGLL